MSAFAVSCCSKESFVTRRNDELPLLLVPAMLSLVEPWVLEFIDCEWSERLVFRVEDDEPCEEDGEAVDEDDVEPVELPALPAL